jgi:hypothetical protein
MKKYGAKEVYKLGIGSDDEDDIEAYFNKWKSGIWSSLVSAFAGSGAEQKNESKNEGMMDVEQGKINEPPKEENLNPVKLDFSKKNPTSSNKILDETPKPLPFEAIISSFHKQQKYSEEAKNTSKYQFKALNYLTYDTLRIGTSNPNPKSTSQSCEANQTSKISQNWSNSSART